MVDKNGPTQYNMFKKGICLKSHLFVLSVHIYFLGTLHKQEPSVPIVRKDHNEERCDSSHEVTERLQFEDHKEEGYNRKVKPYMDDLGFKIKS
jgi:hypothetical protein